MESAAQFRRRIHNMSDSTVKEFAVKLLNEDHFNALKPTEQAIFKALAMRDAVGEMEIRRLLEAGHSPDPLLDNVPPIMICVFDTNIRCAKLFLRHGAKDLKDEYGKNAVHHAVSAKNYMMFPALRKYGFDLDHVDKVGATPLMRAAEMGDTRSVRMLINCGASLTFSNSRGEDAMDYARKGVAKKHLDVCVILEQYQKVFLQKTQWDVPRNSFLFNFLKQFFRKENSVPFTTNELSQLLLRTTVSDSAPWVDLLVQSSFDLIDADNRPLLLQAFVDHRGDLAHAILRKRNIGALYDLLSKNAHLAKEATRHALFAETLSYGLNEPIVFTSTQAIDAICMSIYQFYSSIDPHEEDLICTSQAIKHVNREGQRDHLLEGSNEVCYGDLADFAFKLLNKWTMHVVDNFKTNTMYEAYTTAERLVSKSKMDIARGIKGVAERWHNDLKTLYLMSDISDAPDPDIKFQNPEADRAEVFAILTEIMDYKPHPRGLVSALTYCCSEHGFSLAYIDRNVKREHERARATRASGSLMDMLDDEERKAAKQAEQRAAAKKKQKEREQVKKKEARWDRDVRQPLEEAIMKRENAKEADRGFDASNPPLLSVMRRAGSLPPGEAVKQLTSALSRHHTTGSPELVQQVKALRDSLKPKKQPTRRPAPAISAVSPIEAARRVDEEALRLAAKARAEAHAKARAEAAEARAKAKAEAEAEAAEAQALSEALAAIELHEEREREEHKARIERIELEKRKELESECAICFGPKTASFAMIPCGHVTCGSDCCMKLTTCPFCDTKIASRLRLYV